MVTVADAKHLLQRLKDAPEAEDQIAFADVILLNKSDLVEPSVLKAVERTIRSINPTAVIHRTERCDVPLDRVLDRGAFDLDRILSIDPEFLEADDHDHDHDHDGHDHDHGHHHDHSITSVSLIGGELDPERFFPWVRELTQVQGPDILRLKGIIAFKGDAERYVLQGVHMIIEGDHQRAWREDEVRMSKLVFIGRNLIEDEIRDGFESTRANIA